MLLWAASASASAVFAVPASASSAEEVRHLLDSWRFRFNPKQIPNFMKGVTKQVGCVGCVGCVWFFSVHVAALKK